MGIFGTLWLILIVLKIVGVIHATWLTVILWPLILGVILFVISLLFGLTFTAFGVARR